MIKNTFYFSHDYNSRGDPKIMRLIMKQGPEGIGIYWCIIEMLYEQNGYIPLINIESIAYELHTECERIKNVLQNYELFEFKDDKFYSKSVLRRLKDRNKKSSEARESALKRWHPEQYNDANAMQPHNEGNAIKESKVNKIKGKKKKEEIDLSFVATEWLLLFQEWISYKKSRNENYKNQQSLEACYRNLLKLSNNDIKNGRLILDQAMGNNWQGLFPLKQQGLVKSADPIMSTKYIRS
jgi:hypothetical protein